jgi:hypothetical protein
MTREPSWPPGSPEEEARRQQTQALRDIEAWARHQPPPEPGQPPADPIHLVRVTLPGCPVVLVLARWSTAARLATDAADAGQPGQITDLGRWRGDTPADIAPGSLRYLALLPTEWAA